jgi:hypothetical protein
MMRICRQRLRIWLQATYLDPLQAGSSASLSYHPQIHIYTNFPATCQVHISTQEGILATKIVSASSVQ